MSSSEISSKISKVIQILRDQLASVRAARAIPSLLADIEVEAYGSKMKLVELASITSPDPQLLLVRPWDVSITDNILKAIESSGMGFNPAKEGDVVRVPIPPLSEERRRELVRIVGQRVEEARVVVRRIRQEAMRELDRLEEIKEIGEDEKFRRKRELEQRIQQADEEVKKIGERKKEEILAI